MYSLGAHIDGDGNACSTDDQFLMAKRAKVLNDKNLDNPYQFSPCSIKDIHSYLNKLDT